MPVGMAHHGGGAEILPGEAVAFVLGMEVVDDSISGDKSGFHKAGTALFSGTANLHLVFGFVRKSGQGRRNSGNGSFVPLIFAAHSPAHGVHGGIISKPLDSCGGLTRCDPADIDFAGVEQRGRVGGI